MITHPCYCDKPVQAVPNSFELQTSNFKLPSLLDHALDHSWQFAEVDAALDDG